MRRAKLNGALCSAEAEPINDLSAATPARGKIHKLAPANGPGRGATADPQCLKELVELAREQRYLTFEDISTAAEARQLTPPQIDAVRTKLFHLEIDIVEADRSEPVVIADVAEPRVASLRSLDDPLSLYLNKIGEVPLLTPAQEKDRLSKLPLAKRTKLFLARLKAKALWILHVGK